MAFANTASSAVPRNRANSGRIVHLSEERGGQGSECECRSQFADSAVLDGTNLEFFEFGSQLLKADDRILDCCEYYQDDIRVFGGKNDVILWTDDKNLGLQVRACPYARVCLRALLITASFL